MYKLVEIATATLLIAASATASAWWGDPFISMANELFGDVWVDFDMNMNANTRNSGRSYGWNQYHHDPYTYGPYAYAPYAPPQAPAGPATSAAEDN